MWKGNCMWIPENIDFITDKGRGVFKSKNVYIGEMFYNNCILETPINLQDGTYNVGQIGAFTYANGQTYIHRADKIGRFCSIASQVTIGQFPHPTKLLSHNNIFYGWSEWSKPFHEISIQDKMCMKNRENFGRDIERINSPNIIGNDVWIGFRSIIMGGVKIGDGAIIGAGSVVTKDVEPYTIVGGTPARVIRKRFNDKNIERLLELKWWEYGPNVLKGLNLEKIDKCIYELEERIDKGFPKYTCEKFEIDSRSKQIYQHKLNGNSIKIY